MPRKQLLFCSGFCLMNITALSQALPKHPTSQQVMGYQVHQQQIWIENQQPTNSVLYKLNREGVGPGSGSYQLTFGKNEHAIPLFQTPAAYINEDINNLRLGSKMSTTHKKIPAVGQFSVWKNSSKWRHLYDGGYQPGLISFRD
jgi:hypothetical protein